MRATLLPNGTVGGILTGRREGEPPGAARHHDRRVEYVVDPDWPSRLVSSAHVLTAAERSRLADDVRRGRLRRLVPGVFVDARAEVSERAAHRDRIGARQLVSPIPFVFSHASAAAMWRMPRIGSWPVRVHVTDERAGGGRSTPHVVQHREGHPIAFDVIDGILVTSLARTVIDVARVESVENAIVTVDAALAGVHLTTTVVRVDRTALMDELSRCGARGRAAARFAVEFGSGDSGSPGESLSRLGLHRAGLTRPLLQHQVEDQQGIMFADFAWPQYGLLGEFDGVGKYLRHEWTDGRSPGQVVTDEKWREDRLRALGWRVIRWGWNEARSPALLRARLVTAGLR